MTGRAIFLPCASNKQQYVEIQILFDESRPCVTGMLSLPNDSPARYRENTEIIWQLCDSVPRAIASRCSIRGRPKLSCWTRWHGLISFTLDVAAHPQLR